MIIIGIANLNKAHRVVERKAARHHAAVAATSGRHHLTLGAAVSLTLGLKNESTTAVMNNDVHVTKPSGWPTNRRIDSTAYCK